jgi:hypothetical protein
MSSAVGGGAVAGLSDEFSVGTDRFSVAGAFACGCAPVCVADTASTNAIESPANRIMAGNVPNRI